MRRLAASALTLGLGLAVTTSLAACGGGEDAKLLPGTTARQITQNLAKVRSLAGEGECVAAQDSAQAVGNQIDDLRGIDPKLKEALQKGAERLNEVILTCTEPAGEEETEPTTETTPTKPEKEKPGKEKHEEAEEQNEPAETPKSEQAPPKGEAKGHEQAPPEAAPEAPSGGIGPGNEVGGGN